VNPFLFSVINCDYEKLTIKTPQMVVRRSKAAQPSPMGQGSRPKGLANEPSELSYVLEISSFNSFCRIITFRMPFPDGHTEARTPFVGGYPASQTSR